MDVPEVCNVLHDRSKNIRYELMAYRQLSQAELAQYVRHYLANTKKKPKKNSCVRIVTIIGFDETS
jgi:hypothetical protein